jgi:hypothetical protein
LLAPEGGDVVEDRRLTGDLALGTRVEVKNGYGSSWARGFEVAAVEGGEYVVRRTSDGHVLPETFEADELRKAGPLA